MQYLKAKNRYLKHIIVTPFITFYNSAIFGLIPFFVYILSGIVVSAHKSGIRKGIAVFLIFGLPSGTAISYGALRYLLKRFFEHFKKN